MNIPLINNICNTSYFVATGYLQRPTPFKVCTVAAAAIALYTCSNAAQIRPELRSNQWKWSLATLPLIFVSPVAALVTQLVILCQNRLIHRERPADPNQVPPEPVADPNPVPPDPVADPNPAPPDPEAHPNPVPPDPEAHPNPVPPDPEADPNPVPPEPVADPNPVAPEPAADPNLVAPEPADPPIQIRLVVKEGEDSITLSLISNVLTRQESINSTIESLSDEDKARITNLNIDFRELEYLNTDVIFRLLPQLKKLFIYGPKLKSIDFSQEPNNLKSCDMYVFETISALTSLENLDQLKTLESFSLKGALNFNQPLNLTALMALKHLKLQGLDRFDQRITLTGLKHLKSVELESLNRFDQPLIFQGLKCLESIFLENMPRFNHNVNLEGLEKLTSLTFKGLLEFNQQINFADLASLRELSFEYCSNFNHDLNFKLELTEQRHDSRLTALNTLTLRYCKKFNHHLEFSQLPCLYNLTLMYNEAFQQNIDLSGNSRLNKLNIEKPQDGCTLTLCPNASYTNLRCDLAPENLQELVPGYVRNPLSLQHLCAQYIIGQGVLYYPEDLPVAVNRALEASKRCEIDAHEHPDNDVSFIHPGYYYKKAGDPLKLHPSCEQNATHRILPN